MGRPRFLLVRLSIFVPHFAARTPTGCNRRKCLQLKGPPAHRYFASISDFQESEVSATKWHGLPPVPKQLPRWTPLELISSQIRPQGSSDLSDELNQAKEKVRRVTALQWVTKCCPRLPISLIHKLFRMRQIRKRALLPSLSNEERDPVLPDVQVLAARMRKVSLKAVLEEGTIVYLPTRVFQDTGDALFLQDSRTQRQPTKKEIEWLQSLVLYKDAEILVINKPRGLAVQGGSAVKQDLDSMMRSALSFEYKDGPKLVHRLDKETSGIMVMARTQECALLLHALFRSKTAFPTEPEIIDYGMTRLYRALVIGIPQQQQGRIRAPLLKVVLDEGRVDKMTVAHDGSSKNALFAITDYKVLGPSYYGCTWLELQPRTGRKHQLRVHCAEVLGTPILGDTKYGWRTNKEWLKNVSRDSKTIAFVGAIDRVGSATNPEVVQHSKSVEGSILDKEPRVHLHSLQLSLPNVTRMLEKHRGKMNSKTGTVGRFRFFAPMPPHMAASWDLWSRCRSMNSKPGEHF